MSHQSFDYLIAGGGTAGCTLASRLSLAGYSVALFEAGPEDYSEKVMAPLTAPTLHGTTLEYNYTTVKQPHLLNRELPNFGGRVLGGSSTVNYGNWTRCHSADYDAWADLVGDKRWSYEGLKKYFLVNECCQDEAVSKVEHGFEGPMHTAMSKRGYPLREVLGNALSASGLVFNADANAGNPLGYATLTENWRIGKRQPAGLAYDLSKTSVFLEATVKRIVLNEKTKLATGIELVDGRTFLAQKEVLVCCGSIRTPQLLMLSGIGPASHLSSHNIPVVLDLPVGQNLHDHLSGTLWFKLKQPENGLAIGHPKFMKPEFKDGNPIDWIVTASIADTSKAAKLDKLSSHDPLIQQARGHVEFFISYAPIAAPAFFDYSLAGTHISTPILTLLPTSRGSITLASTDPSDDPIIDPQYFETELDREAFRTGFRLVMHAMLDTEDGQSVIESETPPPGQPQLTSSASDEEIDQRARTVGRSFFQCAGTAAMGKVVDTELKIMGIGQLRVVDASVLPLPLAGHYQCKSCRLANATQKVLTPMSQVLYTLLLNPPQILSWDNREFLEE